VVDVVVLLLFCRHLQQLRVSCNCLSAPRAGSELGQLLEILQQLQVLHVEGQMWEQQAVRVLLQLSNSLVVRGRVGLKILLA
jgi:hypothetical protein